jgi:hypothetical protein
MTRLLLLLCLALLPSTALAQTPVPRATIAAGLGTAKCTVKLEEAMQEIGDVEELGGGLKFTTVPCWRAAYNFGYILFAYDPSKPKSARLLRFRVWEKNALTWQYALGLPSYDAEKKRLRSYYKGRGPSDCGSAGLWRWDGKDFVLESYWLKDDCDGGLFDPEEEPAKWRVFPPKR